MSKLVGDGNAEASMDHVLNDHSKLGRVARAALQLTRTARRIAKRIPGVKRVINDLEMQLGGE